MTRRSSLLRLFIGIAVTAGVVSAQVEAAPPKIGPNGQGTLFVVGDSLTFGADYFDKMQSKLRALGTWKNVVVDAKVGRKSSKGALILADKVRAAPEVTAVVVALGTNDMISHGELSYPDTAIDKVMRAAAGRPVLWVNLRFNSTPRPDWRKRGIRFNKALVRAQSRWSNLTIADWATWFVPKGQVRYISDGVHLTVSGYRVRSGYLVSQARNFGTLIVNATSTTTATSLPTTTTSPESTTSSATTSVPGGGQS